MGIVGLYGGDHRRTRQGVGGGQLPSQIRPKQWGKSGQSKKKKIMCKISGKTTPLPPLTEESPYAHGGDYMNLHLLINVYDS